MTQRGRGGFSAVELVIALLVLGVLGAVAISFMQRTKSHSPTVTTPKQETKGSVAWNFDDKSKTWKATGKAPACPSPLLTHSPTDLTKVTGVLYPGQYRNTNYKPHGAISTAATSPTDVQVVAPMSGTLIGLSRYIETGAVQYKITVRNDCGVDYYFDHLYTLSAALQKVAETTPEPKVDDTKSLPLKPDQQIAVKAGEVVATAAGNPSQRAMGFDFGVLDLRTPNAISRNTEWQALHDTYKASEWFGICWFDGFDADTAAIFKRLPAIDQKSGVRSDYCANELGNTLKVNGGRPV